MARVSPQFHEDIDNMTRNLRMFGTVQKQTNPEPHVQPPFQVWKPPVLVLACPLYVSCGPFPCSVSALIQIGLPQGLHFAEVVGTNISRLEVPVYASSLR